MSVKGQRTKPLARQGAAAAGAINILARRMG
jgi:hypothetical protein